MGATHQKTAGRALIVTPDEKERGVLAGLLKKCGYACSGVLPTGAVRALSHQRYQVVVFHVADRDSDMGTLTTLHELSEDTGIVAVSGNSDDGLIGEAFAAGADGVMIRPGDDARVGTIIAMAIEHGKEAARNRSRIRTLERKLETASSALRQSNEQLERTAMDTIKTFVGFLEARDSRIGSHSRRVAQVSRAIAETYELKDRVRTDIEMAALLHDIGKIGFSDALLLKTRSYFHSQEVSNRDRREFQRHPVIGQETVAMVGSLEQVGLYIRHHHERFDGKGYPDRLTGFYIPLGARVIAVADAYEKIVYDMDIARRSDSRQLFVKFIRKYRDSLFDPEVCDRMIDYMRELSERDREAERRIPIGDLVPGTVLSRDLFTRNGVLLISQYDRVTEDDVARLGRFLEAGMIMDGVYAFMAEPRRKKQSVSVEDESVAAMTVLEPKLVRETLTATREFGILPDMHQSVATFVANPKPARDTVTDIARCDPVAVLKILRLANSPVLGFERDVSSIDDAIHRLGVGEVRNILASIPVVSDTAMKNDRFDRAEFRRHLVGCGIIARIIAGRIGAKHPEDYYTAGLLHDIGKLAFDQLFPDAYRRVLRLVEEESMFYRKAERTVFGMAHEEAAERLMVAWHLTDDLIDASRNHHAPVDSHVDPLLTSAVHLADIIAHMLHIGTSGERSVPRYDPTAEQALAISLLDLETMIPEIDRELQRSEERMPPQ